MCNESVLGILWADKKMIEAGKKVTEKNNITINLLINFNKKCKTKDL